MIMLTQTIQEIKDQISRIENWCEDTRIKDMDGDQGDDVKWGREEEYTSREFKAGIKDLAKDIRMHIKAHAQFVHMSAYEERVQLRGELEFLADHLEAKNYPDACTGLEQLKPRLRSLRARGTTEVRKDLDQQVNESHRLVSLLQVDLEEMKKCLDMAKSHGEFIASLAQQAETNKEQIQEQQTAAQEIQEQLQGRARVVEELTAKTQSHEEIINRFFVEIEARQKQLREQQVATEAYREKLQAYSEEMDQKREEASGLIESAKQALEYTTAVGVSAAFTERYIEYKKQWSWSWVVGAGILISAVPVLAVFWWYTAKELDFVSLIYRFAVVSAVFSGAYFCAAQYRKHKNVQEDYGYKAVLAKSLVGFLEKLPEDAKEVYLAQALSEIHKDPMRKTHEVDHTASESLLSKLLSLKRRGEE